MGKLIFFSAPGVRGLSPDRGVSLWDGKIYSVFLDFLGVYFLDGETNFYFLGHRGRWIATHRGDELGR